MHGSPWTECAWRTAPCMWREQAITVIPMEWSWWMTSNNACEPGEQLIVRVNSDDESDLIRWALLLLAATVWSFAHLWLRLSDRNKIVLWPGCEGYAKCSLHTKNVQSVWFIVKKRGCCCNLSAGVALSECAVYHERNVHEEQHQMYVARTSNNRVIMMEWSSWVTSNNACEPGEQLIVHANGHDESDLVGWTLLLLAATVRSFAHLSLRLSDRNNTTVTEKHHHLKQFIWFNCQKLKHHLKQKCIGSLKSLKTTKHTDTDFVTLTEKITD